MSEDLPRCVDCGYLLPDENPLGHKCLDTLEMNIKRALTKVIEEEVSKYDH